MQTKTIDPRTKEAVVGNLTVRLCKGTRWWVFRIRNGKSNYTDGPKWHKTIKACKQAATKVWLHVQLNDIMDLLKDKLPGEKYSELCVLYNLALSGKDVYTLADWMEDHDALYLLQRRIVAAGNRAKLIWPSGWKEVAERLSK